MNMKKLLAAVLAMTLMLAAAGAYAAEVYEVTTYQQLIDRLYGTNDVKQAENGDTVKMMNDIVRPSTGTGVRKQLIVPTGVILDGNNNTYTADAIPDVDGMILSTGGTIKNLTLVYASRQASYAQAILMTGGLVESVTIRAENNNLDRGIYGSNGTNVKNCTFGSGINYGVSDEGDKNQKGFGEISGCTFNSQYMGNFYFGATVKNNTVNSEKGMTINTATDMEITDNTFTGGRALNIQTDGVEASGNKFLNTSKIELDVENAKVDLRNNYWGGGKPADSRLEAANNSTILVDPWISDPVAGGAAQAGSSMPQTGDGSMLMLWAALLALCGTGMAAMKRAKA